MPEEEFSIANINVSVTSSEGLPSYLLAAPIPAQASMPKEEESSTVNTSLLVAPVFGVRQGSVLSPQVRYLLQEAVAKHERRCGSNP